MGTALLLLTALAATYAGEAGSNVARLAQGRFGHTAKLLDGNLMRVGRRRFARFVGPAAE